MSKFSLMLQERICCAVRLVYLISDYLRKWFFHTALKSLCEYPSVDGCWCYLNGRKKEFTIDPTLDFLGSSTILTFCTRNFRRLRTISPKTNSTLVPSFADVSANAQPSCFAAVIPSARDTFLSLFLSLLLPTRYISTDLAGSWLTNCMICWWRGGIDSNEDREVML